MIICNSLLTLSYLTLTAFAHVLKNKGTIALAQCVRLLSLCASALIMTMLLGTYSISAILFAYHHYAVYGVFWLLALVWANAVALKQYERLSEVVMANLLIAVMLLMFKLQCVATNTASGPHGITWVLYSMFYLCAAFGFQIGGRNYIARQWATILGNRLRWIDSYIALNNPEDFAIRNTCALCFTLLNITYFVIVGSPVCSYAGVLLLGQFFVTLCLALRFSTLCPNATLEHGFVIVMYKRVGSSIATACIQLSRGILPDFNPWLFAIVLFSGLNHTNVAYCSEDNTELEVGKPVGESNFFSRSFSRGASYAGEALRGASQWAAENPQTANYATGVASGVTGTIAGEIVRQQYMLPDSGTARLTETTEDLGQQVRQLETALREKHYLEQRNRELELELKEKSQQIADLEAQQKKRFWHCASCFRISRQ